MHLYRRFALVFSLAALGACAGVNIQDEIGATAEVRRDAYESNKEKLGLVLLDARWGRQWRCGEYENAQLVSFSFDRYPLSAKSNTAPADLTIGTTSLLSVKPVFESYALLVPPGEYALSNFRIKVAKSTSNVGYWDASRSHLIKDGKPLAGKFSVAAGESVYIGNFALDCTYSTPTLWRYYSEGQEGFKRQLADYKAKYPFLDLANARYRLLETDTIGQPYQLK